MVLGGSRRLASHILLYCLSLKIAAVFNLYLLRGDVLSYSHMVCQSVLRFPYKKTTSCFSCSPDSKYTRYNASPPYSLPLLYLAFFSGVQFPTYVFPHLASQQDWVYTHEIVHNPS